MDRKLISVLHKSHGFQAWIKKSASIFGNFFIINNEIKNYVTKQSRVYWSQDILWSRGFWPLCVVEEGTVRMEYECSFGESAVINITPGELLICLEMVLYWPMLLMLGHPAVVKAGLLIVCTISISSVQFSHSVVFDSLPPHESQHARPPCPSSTPGVHPDSHLSNQWCHPAISSSVFPFSSCPSIPPSIRVFSNESTLRMRWPKYWNFSFSIIPSKEIPGLIFRMDWLDLLAVQGTLNSLL